MECDFGLTFMSHWSSIMLALNAFGSRSGCPTSAVPESMSGGLHSQIRYPNAQNKDILLEALKLDRLPSRDEIHESIRDKWLTPKDTLPAHWLDRYQMFVGFPPHACA